LFGEDQVVIEEQRLRFDPVEAGASLPLQFSSVYKLSSQVIQIQLDPLHAWA
jgi:hypothetical protein